MPEEEYRESDDSEDDFDQQIAWSHHYSNNNTDNNNMDGYEDESSRSEDDGPQAVSNAAAKAEALTEMISAAQATQQQRDKVREKRRNACAENEQRNLQAKKQRLEAIESKRLDESLLDAIAPANHQQSPTKIRKNSIKKLDLVEIPTSSTQFRVKRLSSESKSVVANAEKLQQLKEKYLTGKSKRESVKKAMAKIRKQTASRNNAY